MAIDIKKQVAKILSEEKFKSDDGYWELRQRCDLESLRLEWHDVLEQNNNIHGVHSERIHCASNKVDASYYVHGQYYRSIYYAKAHPGARRSTAKF